MLVDIGLPDMSGHEAARKLRDLPAVRDAVLVAVTGYGQEDERRRSLAAGFESPLDQAADLRKPVSAPDVPRQRSRYLIDSSSMSNTSVPLGAPGRGELS